MGYTIRKILMGGIISIVFQLSYLKCSPDLSPERRVSLIKMIVTKNDGLLSSQLTLKEHCKNWYW
jgi:hypothetical protein